MPDPQYPPQLLEVFERIENATDYVNRRELIIALASVYQRVHDDSDSEVHPDLHKLVEDFETAKLAFQHVSLRLGRAIHAEMSRQNGAKISVIVAPSKESDPPN